MGERNLQVVNNVLNIDDNGAPGEVVTRIGATGVGWQLPAGTGTVGPGTPGTVAIFTAATTVGDVAPGIDTTLNVPVGHVGVFAINGASLIQFKGSGFSPTVNAGVASGDAAHVWANVYGRSLLSDDALTLNAVTTKTIKLQVNASTVLVIGQPTVPTTWTWPIADAAGIMVSNGAGVLSLAVPPAWITGIAAQNAGVPVAGGPWQTLDAITGTLADGGGGVLQYTPPGGGAAAWTTLSKPADQSTALLVYVADTDLITPALVAGTKYRVRARIMLNNTGGGSFGINVKWVGPAMTVYKERIWFQNPGGGGNVNCSNVASAPGVYNSGNTGDGSLEYFIVFTPSAPGTFGLQFEQVPAGVGTITIYAGSYMEYGIA
jgi:hypothetical protein